MDTRTEADMSDPEYLLSLAKWFEEQQIEFDADRLLDIADNYARLVDDNKTLDRQVQQLTDELQEEWAR